MRRGFVTLESGQQLHFRSVGEGPPLVMLHASPQNSEACLPAAQVFAKYCHCIAFDTPGYGLSDSMTQDTIGMADYADTFIAAIDKMGISDFCLYGAATGSQIAIEMGKLFPERVKFLMLDSNGHVGDMDRDQILDGYFPDVVPTPGGGHLLTYWEMCRSLFAAFPWTSGKTEDAFATDLPSVNVVQDVFMRYLDAGEGYNVAYRAAFMIENRQHMDGLNVLTIMTRWENSPVLVLADALIDEGLPDCVTLLHASGNILDRFQVQAEALQEALQSLNLPSAKIPMAETPRQGGLKSRFLGAEYPQIYARINMSGSGVPLVFLHGAGRSGSEFSDHSKTFTGKRPVIVLDLPGHGASSGFVASPSLEEMIEWVAGAVAGITREPIEVIGRDLGAAIGMGLANYLPVKQVLKIDDSPLSAEECADYLANGIPDFKPDMDGAHLPKIWSMVRAQQLYKIWYNPEPSLRQDLPDADLRPSYLHQRVKEILQTGSDYSHMMRLAMGYDWEAAQKGFNIPFSEFPRVDMRN